jgi:hypothetical protein
MNIPHFRAYNKERNILADVLQIDWANHTVTVLIDSARANQETWGFDEIELNQYTRVLDSNKVEICEEDLINFHSEDYQVYFSSRLGWLATSYYMDGTADELLGYIENECKIIGNKYNVPLS